MNDQQLEGGYYFARYGKLASVECFWGPTCAASVAAGRRNQLSRNDNVLLKTDRGTEWGVILGASDKSRHSPERNILRLATPEDYKRKILIDEVFRPEEYSYCREQIKQLKLDMKLIDVDHLFGDEKIVFYFFSPVRVDFRGLVRSLASRFNCMIELRQIGARDTTRVSGGCGSCGRTLCCASWKKDLGGIAYEMAQVQFENPEQQMLLGVCGKLKCCLKYEYENYVRSLRILPPLGSRIKTPDGDAIVRSRNLGLGMVTVEDNSGRRSTLPEEFFVAQASAHTGSPPPATQEGGGHAPTPPAADPV